MSAFMNQKDLVTTYKKETCSNLRFLSKIYTMPLDVSTQIFKENCLEKPTQHLFIHLTFCLVSIIDPQKASSFTWPLYDSKAEKLYRNELSKFIVGYYEKGSISPVMSSYFVNPSCYKVTVLIYQLSQLAVEKALQAKMKSKRHLNLYNCASEYFKSGDKEPLQYIENETKVIRSKFRTHQHNAQVFSGIAESLRKMIMKNEETLNNIKQKELLTKLVDGFLKERSIQSDVKSEIEKIKDVNVPAPIFDVWLSQIDDEILKLETEWDKVTSPLLNLTRACRENTECLVGRHTGEINKQMYMIEYNSAVDPICTKELEPHVNSEQKHILRNIVKNDRLSFPNLIRGFVISTCYILKNMESDEDIYKVCEYLESRKESYNKIVGRMKMVNHEISNIEAELKPQCNLLNHTSLINNLLPPPLDFSDLKRSKETNFTLTFDNFTPLNLCRHQFNLRGRTKRAMFDRQIKPLIPFPQMSKDDVFKSFSSYRSSNERSRLSMSQNISMISQSSKANQTIAESMAGFTKMQLQRLLSTKTKSSAKKRKSRMDHSNVHVKKGGLFNETCDSSILVRSHSSPNLGDNIQYRDRRTCLRERNRKLSIMQEDNLLEVSGISILHTDSRDASPQKNDPLENTGNLMNATSLPTIVINNAGDSSSTLKDLSRGNCLDTLAVEETVTPKSNTSQRRTSSMEKIINRYKKVRANIRNDTNCLKTAPENDTSKIESFKHYVAIEEQKVNKRVCDDFYAGNWLSPVLTPTSSVSSKKHIDFIDNFFFDDDKVGRPRESLGTVLGVDEKFLDQFELID